MTDKKKDKKKGNMYGDSIKQWNCFVGCMYDCVYCERSFKAQMKRQKQNCLLCYQYIPHFHEKRLYDSLPKTKGDEFIWCCASSDITFCRPEWMEDILAMVRIMPKKNFFFQSKNPSIFEKYDFPDNTLIGTTIESNKYYPNVSKAPRPEMRYEDFLRIKHPRKVVTIEPIMQFDMWTLVKWMKNINPERIYIGYDTKKSNLLEPTLSMTTHLIHHLEQFTKVKRKYIPEEKIKTIF